MSVVATIFTSTFSRVSWPPLYCISPAYDSHRSHRKESSIKYSPHLVQLTYYNPSTGSDDVLRLTFHLLQNCLFVLLPNYW